MVVTDLSQARKVKASAMSPLTPELGTKYKRLVVPNEAIRNALEALTALPPPVISVHSLLLLMK